MAQAFESGTQKFTWYGEQLEAHTQRGSGPVRMRAITLPIAIVLLTGCSSTKVADNIKSNMPETQAETILLKKATANQPPPFWPPHEHEIPAEKIDHRFHIHLQIIQAQQQDIWNHTGFDHDPTTN